MRGNIMNVTINALGSSHIESCAEILCAVYNNELWQCRWSADTAQAYLSDFYNAEKFVGFVIEGNGEVLGAMFAREKIWWNNSELFIEEMFVKPEYQGKGYGSRLIEAAEKYVKDSGLAGFTLSTNKFSLAPDFYKKNGFSVSEHVIYMYKEI